MSTIIRKSLLDLIFSGAYMKRWNDKLRPIELVEVDKQAHKMIVAWLLFMVNSRGMNDDDRLEMGRRIVEGGMFDYLYRLIITDIKPPVFYRIKENPQDYKKLSTWVLGRLRPMLVPLGNEFWESMTNWHLEREDSDQPRRILSAAHLYASYYEFKLIKGVNPPGFDMADIEQSFVARLGALAQDVKGVDSLLVGLEDNADDALGKLAALCGQLRFQQRWSQTPRVPETSVLGHMFIVAAFSWFFSMEVGACRARLQNNFFGGLFHDLPEMLTRDIISPVKQSAPEIADLIRNYEELETERVVLGPLCQGGYEDIANRLEFFLGTEIGSEFRACVMESGKVKQVSSLELAEQYNEDCFDPKDGELLKVCDRLSAFIEAYVAIKNGIAAEQLHSAVWSIRGEYENRPEVAGIQISAVLADFG